jgi:Asp-tRNA(Asn)/Glu-tRNA(Gln) amidotransferase B subunit
MAQSVSRSALLGNVSGKARYLVPLRSWGYCAAHAAQRRFEQEFCEGYLPKGVDEAAVRALVKERLAALGIADAKQVGRLIGDIMKTHKGQVEAGDVKRIAEELLKG